MWPTASANWSMTASSSDTAVGKALAGFDGAAVDLDRMHRRAARADQQPLAHHEAQAHDGVGGLRDFLLQVGHHADDLVAEHVEAQVFVRPEQRFARELGQRRVLRDPGAAARVGERQMHPGPADVVGERRLDRARWGNGSALPSGAK